MLPILIAHMNQAGLQYASEAKGQAFLIKKEALGFQLCSGLVLYLWAYSSSSHYGAFCPTMQSGPYAEREVANTAPLTPALTHHHAR